MNNFSLEQYLSVVHHMPGACVLKTIDSIYVGGNQLCAETIGYQKSSQIEGITDFDMKCGAVSLADEFISGDKLTLKQGQTEWLCFGEYADKETKIMHAFRKVVKNNQDEPIGILGHMSPANRFLKQIFSLSLSDIGVNKERDVDKICNVSVSFPDIDLTYREAECMFYLIRGRRTKEISNIMEISPRTVEAHIANIRQKTDCHCLSNLIELSFERGYFNIIIDRLIRKKNFILSLD